jgi:putative selenium metabolism protein SsnA
VAGILALPEATLHLVSADHLVTFGETNAVHSKAAVVIEGGKVVEIGPKLELVAKYPNASVDDFPNCTIIPGKINSHDHLYSAFARGISLKDEAPNNFLEILERLWWRLDRALTLEDCYLSAKLCFAEAVRSGTTTIVDHHASPGAILGSLDQLARASQEVGLRGCFCYEVTDRNGEVGAQQGVDESLRFLERCKQEKNPLLSGALGLHASITVGPETLKKCLDGCSDDVYFHVHVAEDGCDVEHAHKTYGCGPLERLLREGLSERKVLAAHCIHLDAKEQALLKQHGITVLHNPRSNMNNAVGCAPVAKLNADGIRVCLGTDGMSQDPWQDLQALSLIHKHHAGHPQSFSYGDIHQVGIANPADLASELFGTRLGELSVGSAADIAILQYDPPTPLNAGNTLGHILFGMTYAPVRATICHGRFVYRNGSVIGVDEQELYAKCRENAEKLWQRW